MISHPLQIKTAVQEQSPDVDVNELLKQAAALQQVSTPPPTAAQPDVVANFEKLAKLREDGVLTEEEFQVQKAKLLA